MTARGRTTTETEREAEAVAAVAWGASASAATAVAETSPRKHLATSEFLRVLAIGLAPFSGRGGM
jgi:hypothetical protein